MGLALMCTRRGRKLLLLYALICRTTKWQNLFNEVIRFGVKKRPVSYVNKMPPLEPPDKKRYMVAFHPHSVLMDGAHMVIAQHPNSFDDDNNEFLGIKNFKPTLCLAPVIKYIPGHQELWKRRCGGVSKKDLEWVLKNSDCSPTICPGGFAEAVWAQASTFEEYSYIPKGFIATCIQLKLDIIPVYSIGTTTMYRTNTKFRTELSKLAQKYKVPMVFFWGKFGLVPFHSEVVTVLYPPFSVQECTLQDVNQAWVAYKSYLTSCYNSDRH